MTPDEIIGLFQKNIELPGCPHNWREALREAIGYLRTIKDADGWVERPKCPECGEYLWRDDYYECPYGWKCDEHGLCNVETRHKVTP